MDSANNETPLNRRAAQKWFSIRSVWIKQKEGTQQQYQQLGVSLHYRRWFIAAVPFCCLSPSLSLDTPVWNTLLDLSDVLYEPEFLTPIFPEKLQAHRLTHFPMINATGNYLNVNGGNTHAHSHAHYSYTNQHKHSHRNTSRLSVWVSASSAQPASAAHQRRTIKAEKQQ